MRKGAKIMAKKNKQTQVVNSGVVSDFDGTVWSYIGVGVLEFLVMALMLGIGAAAMLVLGPESISLLSCSLCA
jgi:hypothetical protein